MGRMEVRVGSFTRALGFSILVAGVIGLAAPAQAQIPAINVQKTCKAAASVMVNLAISGGSTDEVQICLNSENSARETMTKNWSTYQASDRSGCFQTNVYLPSYVEWLTCIEMNKVVREVKSKGRLLQTIENPDGTYTLPPLRTLGILGGQP
jgi:hypothetical protein